MLLMIDNYDSFTHNLSRYFKLLGEEIKVVQNDKITIEEIKQLQPEAIILSPGPKRPQDAKICLDVVTVFSKTIPIFGVCLGHQVIGYINDCIVEKAPVPIHGKQDFVYKKCDDPILENIPNKFIVTRYHSLHVKNNDNIKTIAATEDNIVMISKVKNQCTYSVQYHPESFLTEYGLEILENFLKLAREYNVQKNR